MDKNNKVTVAESGPITGVDGIPISVFLAGEREGDYLAKPLLNDLAKLTIKHYNIYSAYTNTNIMTSFPVMFINGFTDIDENGQKIKLALSPNVILTSQNPQATAQYIEPSANGVAAMKDLIADLEAKMDYLGLDLLAENEVNSTATADIINYQENNAAVRGFRKAIEQGTESMLKFYAQFMNQPHEGIEVSFEEEEIEVVEAVPTEVAEVIEEEVVTEEIEISEG
jgi:hypothetical protein